MLVLMLIVPTHEIPSAFRGGGHLFYTATRHRVSPEFIGPRNHCRDFADTGPVVIMAVPVKGAVFAGHHGPINVINVCLSFPTPTNGMKWASCLEYIISFK